MSIIDDDLRNVKEVVDSKDSDGRRPWLNKLMPWKKMKLGSYSSYQLGEKPLGANG